MAEPASVLESVGLWEKVGPRYQAMIRALGPTFKATDRALMSHSGTKSEHWPADMWRAVAWFEWTEAFVEIARLTESSGDLAPLRRHIERGYRRMLFETSDEIKRVGLLEGDDSDLIPLTGSDIDDLRTR